MATFSHISGQEPSTVTFKAATITQTRNSSVMHQEIISLGDPNTPAAIAECSSSAPTSSFVGLVTKEAGGFLSSVGGIVTVVGNVTVAGNSSVAVSGFGSGLVSSVVPAANSSGLIVRNVWSSTNTDQPVSAAQSGTWNINVVTSISSLSTGHVTVDAGNSSVTVSAFAAGLQSTTAPAGNSSALNVRIVGGPSSAADLALNVSSVAGSVHVMPNSTAWASSAGFHFNSSGELNVAGSFTASVSSISSIAGVVTVTPNSTAPTTYYPVRISDGSTWVTDYLNASSIGTPTNVAGGVSFLRAGSNAASSNDLFVMPWGSTAGHQAVMISDTAFTAVHPGDATNNAVRVNVVAGAAFSTVVTVSTIQGAVTVRSSAANLLATVYQSPAAKLNVTVAGYSTINAISSISGRVGVAPSDTNWASSAGFHFNSSGELLSVASLSASTGPLTVSQLLSTSGGTVTVGDTSNNALRVNVVAGAAAGSTIVTISAFDAALISSAAAAGNSSALNVRVVGGASSAGDFLVRPVFSSTSTDNPVSAVQSGTWTVNLGAQLISSAAPAGNSSGLVVRIAGGPSSAADCAINVSSVGGVVHDMPNSTAWASSAGFHFDSTGGLQVVDMNAQYSTVAPSSGTVGLVTRPIIDTILTVASTSAFATSTSFSIQSSGAGLRSYVTAYSILTTNAGPTQIAFYSSGTMTWPILTAAVSSALSGANLAVSAPAYLFRTNAAEALTLQMNQSSIAGYVVAVSYFRAP